MGFQAPYTSSPYGAGIPSTSGPPGQFNPNYMMANPMGGFPLSAAGMNPQQQMMQRMQQQAQQNSAGMGTPTPPRQFSASQATPNLALSSQQGQFGTPSNPQAPPQNQTPTQAPQSATSVSTPQTPTFPSTGQGPAVNGNSTPLSPTSQAKGQERISLLLEINQELLYEAVHLKHSMDEIKKEQSNFTGPEQQKERREEEEAFSHDWAQYVTFTTFDDITQLPLTTGTGSVGGYKRTLHTWPRLQIGRHLLKQRPLTLYRRH